MSTVIKVENLSKQYRLGTTGTGTISHDINRAWYRIRGKEDPYLKIGEENERSKKGSSDYVWALRDINFDVKQGEVLGIIGRNGAGKSTLLKILSRTTSPTTGSIKIKGRVASLLEVGTGFHPELSGRENIFLNGAILGMTRQEIKSKFDEIVDFAGVERYIDTPVKRYSSGMYVRLAFGVAAHLEPEILIVDEVLAVGDAEFQKKAIGKMQDISEGQGRTVLFVSHNMASIRRLCNNGLILKNGTVNFLGNIDETLSEYENESELDLEDSDSNLKEIKRQNNLGTQVLFRNVTIYNLSDEEINTVYFGESFFLELEIESIETSIDDLNLGIRFENSNDVYITSCLSEDANQLFSIEENKIIKIRVFFDHLKLSPGNVYVTLSIRKGKLFYDQVVKAKKITILGYGKDSTIVHNGAWGLVNVNSTWKQV